MSAEEPEAKSEGYHYWHDKVGSEAPVPTPQLLAAEPVAAAVPEKSIDSFGLMDDDDDHVVKLYVALEGDLEGVTNDAVESQFTKAPFDDIYSMEVKVRGSRFTHRLAADKLAGTIVPEQCKCRVSKKGDKLIVTLRKRDSVPWGQLRANVSLPYRRGGGGVPR